MTTTNRIKGLKKWALILALWLILQKAPLRAQYSALLSATGTGVEFEFQADGSLISQGWNGSGGLDSGDQGAGTRLLWWPYQAAFRAGYVNGSQWDTSNIGPYSTAFGINTTASGYASTASGYLSSASGVNACFAAGWQTTAGLSCDTSFGFETLAAGGNSTSFGQGTCAYGWASTASGFYSTASGYYSTTAGADTIAQAWADFAVGSDNLGGGTSNAWIGTDPLFEVGNGPNPADDDNPSDALEVLKNGNTIVSGTLSVSGSNPVLVYQTGDISMGGFTSGPHPQ
jgi:hypothetical protein